MGAYLYFHYSVDDVFISLIEVTDNDIPLIQHPFFRDLKLLYNKYNLITTLYTFGNGIIDGRLRQLSEVRSLQEEISEGWLKFAPHTLNFKTPPFTRTLDQNLTDFQNIFDELLRISEGNISRSIRLHYYSECFEMQTFFKSYGIEELFTTDKPAVTYRLPEIDKNYLAKNGTHLFNGLWMTSTHFRVEDLANQGLTPLETYEKFSNTLEFTNRLILYSHECEHSRNIVQQQFFKSIKILTQDLNLVSTW